MRLNCAIPPILVANRGDLMIFESLEDALEYVEPIDVEANEYEFFNSGGWVIHLRVDRGKIVADENLGPPDPDRLASAPRDYLRRIAEARVGLSQTELARADLTELAAARQRAEAGSYREPGVRRTLKWFLPWLFRGEPSRWTPRR